MQCAMIIRHSCRWLLILALMQPHTLCGVWRSWYVPPASSQTRFSPPLRNVFALLLLHLDIWASLCQMMYVQSLTLEGCFYIHLLERKSSSVLTSLTCQLKPIMVQYGTYTSLMCELGASSAHTLRPISNPSPTPSRSVAGCNSVWSHTRGCGGSLRGGGGYKYTDKLWDAITFMGKDMK